MFAGDTMKGSRRKRRRGAPVPTLTIACHPSARRIGDRLRMPELELGRTIEVGRLSPPFQSFHGPGAAPLEDSFISRSPLRFRLNGDALDMEAGGDFALAIDGIEVSGVTSIERSRLASGVTITLAHRVVLVLHLMSSRSKQTAGYGLVGASEALNDVRAEIAQVASSELAVLLRGESGTGKELVARALHDAGGRAHRPFVSVNMAAIPPSVAASELFGHRRGAFTGAAGERKGVFEQADGGTLFLDEIGETPSEVQPLLLRALESGEIQPVGGGGLGTVDVRVVAATDADLDRAVADGSFRLALLHRLQAYEFELPALRERREDIGVLLVHFLRAALGERAEALLETSLGDEAWLDVDLVEPLLRYHWPGNVRQLLNVARQLALVNADMEVADMTRAIAKMLPSRTAAAEEEARTAAPNASSDEQLIAVLRANHFRVGPSAVQLGISKNALYRWMEKSPLIRKAGDLTPKEIADARARTGDDATMMADQLEVSKHGLMLRMRALEEGDATG